MSEQAQVDVDLDERVQAIRCTGCYRLRAYPVKNIDSTRACSCGTVSFIKTFPHDDEFDLAMKLYSEEVERFLCTHPSALR